MIASILWRRESSSPQTPRAEAIAKDVVTRASKSGGECLSVCPGLLLSILRRRNWLQSRDLLGYGSQHLGVAVVDWDLRRCDSGLKRDNVVQRADMPRNLVPITRALQASRQRARRRDARS